jgi:hypothetical protein
LPEEDHVEARDSLALSESSWSRSGIGEVEQRLISLEAEIHEAEHRIRKDLLERDRAWRDWMVRTVSLLCRMLAAGVSPAAAQRDSEDVMAETAGNLPRADLEPRPITLDEYHAYTPEKFELWDGYLFYGPDYPDARRRLLALLLANVGLLEAVALAPEAQWREALKRVYG